MEASADVSMVSGHAAGVYNCPQNGCIRVFQRVSTSERHLSLENHVLINFTKMCYKPSLEYALPCYSKPQAKAAKAVKAVS